MNYAETLDFLYNAFPAFHQIGSAAYKPGLEHIARFCRSLGDPQRDYAVIHVAGTNGKGSVSHMLAAVLQAAGYRTGLFTSPHLIDFGERIRVDGQTIPHEKVTAFVDRHRGEMEELGLSFFEMSTALAFDFFSEAGVEVAVVETGLGGRLDATNIVQPILSVITNIGLEHTEYLGNTRAEIAGEKAGIIKPGVPVVVGQSHPECDPVFTARAAAQGSPLVFADRTYRCLDRTEHPDGIRYTVEFLPEARTLIVENDLTGIYQTHNLLTVLTAVRLLRKQTPISISTRALQTGLRHAATVTGLQGRWQVIGRDPLLVCDTGHNAHGLAEVTAQLRELSCRKLFIVLGVCREKDLAHILPLLPAKAHYLFTRASTQRALPADQLLTAASAYGLTGQAFDNVDEALAAARSLAAPEDAIFIGGSTFVVGDALKTLFPESCGGR